MPGAIEKNRAGGHKSAGGRWPGCAHGVGLKDLLAAVLIMALTAAVLLSLIADMHRRADAEDPEKLAALSEREFLIEAVRTGRPVHFTGGLFGRLTKPPQDVGQALQSPSNAAPAKITCTRPDDGGVE